MIKNNKWLIGGVIAVAIIAVGFYVYRFWGKSLSTDSGDWADFATYISGTVGVAAVVATLLAFVKTLGQQQALIDSQDKMLGEQRRNIEILELQHKRDKAYKTTLEAFPLLIESFKYDLKNSSNIYMLDHELEGRKYRVRRFDKLHSYFDLSEQVFEEVKRSCLDPLDDVYSEYGPMQFDRIYRICSFILHQISIDEDLLPVFDYYLSRDFGFGKVGWFYIDCYYQFQFGRGTGNEFPVFSKFDVSGVQGEPIPYRSTHRWREIGESVKAHQSAGFVCSG